MSRPRLPRVSRQFLVPLLGFIALNLFVINFFTFLSHAFDPARCSASARSHDAIEQVVVTHFGRSSIEVRHHALVRELRRAESELRVAERKMQCSERAARKVRALRELRERDRLSGIVAMDPLAAPAPPPAPPLFR